MPAATPAAEDFSPLRFERGALLLLDQTRLPAEERWLRLDRVEAICDAIRRLAVRGAPAIGIAAAYGLVVGLVDEEAPHADLPGRFAWASARLGATRPTAVNLHWALAQGARAFAPLAGLPPLEAAARLLDWARALHADDVDRNRRIAAHGATLFAAGERALTHCNTGALATGGVGTALGVLLEARRLGRLELVWVDETRPLLQGARLTAWELLRAGVPHKLVTDSMAGALMARGRVDRVIVGADRIARNGDFANKIGTYPLAVLAHRHGIPFHVAAPLSTFDPATPSGEAIPIEERAGREVTEVAGERIAPVGTEGFNLAFDVTPAELVAAIVTEAGVLRPPYAETIARALGGA